MAGTTRRCRTGPVAAGRRTQGGRQAMQDRLGGRGDDAEVQSTRAYTDTQHLTTRNASPPERAAESRVILAKLEDRCPNRASVYWQQISPCGLSRTSGNYHPRQLPQQAPQWQMGPKCRAVLWRLAVYFRKDMPHPTHRPDLLGFLPAAAGSSVVGTGYGPELRKLWCIPPMHRRVSTQKVVRQEVLVGP